MKALLEWTGGYRPSTHTLVGALSVLQAAYLADPDMRRMMDRLMMAHPMVQVLTGYCLLVLALYRNGAVRAKN